MEFTSVEDIVVETVGEEPFFEPKIETPPAPIQVPLSYIEKEVQKPRVLVLGGTGYVGFKIIQELSKLGLYDIRALSRKNSADKLRPYVKDIFIGEATDDASLAGICQDVDFVISTLGVRGNKKPSCWDVDYQGNLNVLNRALNTSSVKFFLFLSIIHGDNEAVRKSIPNVEARERIVDALKETQRYGTRKLKYAVVRTTGLFNDMAALFESVLQGYGYVPGEGNWRFNPIHGEDVAKYMVDNLVNYESLQQGPESFSMNEVIKLGYKVTRRQTTTITRVPMWLRSTSTVKPFFDNVTSMLSAHDKMDCVGKSVGTRTLQELFTDIYLGKNSQSHPGYREVIVHSKAFMEKVFEVTDVGGVLKWEFFTEKKDIGFGVYYADTEFAPSRTALVKVDRVQSHLDKGQAECEKAGIYFVRWDNCYSTFTKKLLYYKVELIKK